MRELLYNRLGEESVNTEGHKMLIVKYSDTNNIEVQFIDKNKAIVKSAYKEFKKGIIKNPYHRSYLGKGFFGQGKHKARIGRKKTKCYIVWGSMLTRCYSEKTRYKNLTYKNTEVCEKWLNFQNFANWFHKNYNPNTMIGWELDKDILGDNNVYSPENCVFIPKELNTFFSGAKERDLPRGIYKTKYGYKSINYQSTSKSNLSSTFKNIQDAVCFYENSRKIKIKELLLKYDNLDKRVINKLNQIIK